MFKPIVKRKEKKNDPVDDFFTSTKREEQVKHDIALDS
ncbi:hypothetical protein SORDD17_01870 [Streptococcus oralis]|uniref:Uncharacterized protein n=1 Tax=Streptococcus oralis TaxID=1303 RepID=A0A139RAP8_STROR|nr:hypothetical protein SORDD17_01870 [Streptococcus oralis]